MKSGMRVLCFDATKDTTCCYSWIKQTTLAWFSDIPAAGMSYTLTWRDCSSSKT